MTAPSKYELSQALFSLSCLLSALVTTVRKVANTGPRPLSAQRNSMTAHSPRSVHQPSSWARHAKLLVLRQPQSTLSTASHVSSEGPGDRTGSRRCCPWHLYPLLNPKRAKTVICFPTELEILPFLSSQGQILNPLRHWNSKHTQKWTRLCSPPLAR